jgi:crotonobetainyl-CoA:carnitine CoA-transferase CaiB-like acyl-CoA transferase
MAALLHARATGQGQHIDIALFDVQAAMLANQATNYLRLGQGAGADGQRPPQPRALPAFSVYGRNGGHRGRQ